MSDEVPAWFARQSAVIPYRRTPSEIEIALITSHSGKRWIVPKGVIDPGETPVGSAVREALEEAGLEGRVDPEAVGRYAYEKWGMTCTVEVFLLEVTVVHDEWDEDSRTREWVSVEEAAARCREVALKEMVLGVPGRIG